MATMSKNVKLKILELVKYFSIETLAEIKFIHETSVDFKMGKMVEERSDDIKNQMGTKEYRNYKSQAQPLPRHVMETPPGLISRIVSEVVSLSELEPCGVRGELLLSCSVPTISQWEESSWTPVLYQPSSSTSPSSL